MIRISERKKGRGIQPPLNCRWRDKSEASSLQNLTSDPDDAGGSIKHKDRNDGRHPAWPAGGERATTGGNGFWKKKNI